MDAELLGQGPGIDAGDARDAALPEPFAEAFGRRRVRGLLAELRDNVAGDPRLLGFEARGIDPVVADERISLAEDLAVVGRVGDALRVADDPGIENDFPPDFSGRAETYALVDGAVREDQNAFSDGACLRFILAQYSTSPGRDSI